MKKLIKFLRKSQRNNVFYILSGAQMLCLIAYFFSSKGLEKPAGVIEALKFMFTKPDQYFFSIFVGIGAWLISIALLVAVVREIQIIKDFFDDDYSYYSGYEYLEDISKNKYIINIIIVIVLIILNFIFLDFLGALLLGLGAIILGITIFIWMQN